MRLCNLVRGIFFVTVSAVAGFGCSEQDRTPPPPGTPVANIVITPNNGAKPLDVLLDASGSDPVEASIEKYEFDFGDGTPIYTEEPGNAPDGTFDGQTNHTYTQEGNYAPAVTVTNTSGKTDIALDLLGVGFGADKTGAENYVKALFSANSLIVYEDSDFQVPNPSTGFIVAFTADVEGYDSVNDKSKYFIYDWDSLTQEQRDTLTARQSASMDEPKILAARKEDSPQTIDYLLGF